MDLDDQQAVPRFLIPDRDSKFSGPFDEVLRTEGIRVIRTPVQAPKANAFAERRVQTVRAECLDWTLALGCRHLERLLRTYDKPRPHRGLGLGLPEPPPREPAPALFKLEHVSGIWLADVLARLQVRYPEVQVVFADSRCFAEEWTYRFLVAALADATGPALRE